MFQIVAMIVGGVILVFAGTVWLLLYHSLYVKTTIVPMNVPAAPPLILVHISDVHGRIRFLNGPLHRLVNRWQPDIICVTGDLAQHQGQLTGVLEEIGKLVSRCGIYFVPGNYEREEALGWGGRKRGYTPEAYAANKKLWRERMTVLENSGRRVVLEDGRSISVYGFDNSIYGNERYAGIGEEKSDFRVHLSHSPNIISLIREQSIRCDLLLTGHTHGGQVRLFGRTVGAYKHFHVGAIPDSLVGVFAISRGLGTARLPLRWNCFPEIAVYFINQ